MMGQQLKEDIHQALRARYGKMPGDVQCVGCQMWFPSVHSYQWITEDKHAVTPLCEGCFQSLEVKHRGVGHSTRVIGGAVKSMEIDGRKFNINAREPEEGVGIECGCCNRVVASTRLCVGCGAYACARCRDMTGRCVVCSTKKATGYYEGMDQ